MNFYQISDSIGLSFGPRKFDYYFENGQLLYAPEKELNYYRNADGGADYAKPLAEIFDAKYYFDNGFFGND